MSNKIDKYDVYDFIINRTPTSVQAVIVDNETLTHNVGDYFRSLNALDTALTEIGYNRNGITILSAADWLTKQIVSGYEADFIIRWVCGMPKNLQHTVRMACKKFQRE